MNKRYLWIAILLVFGIVNHGFATESEKDALEGPLTISLSAQNTNCAGDPHGSATVTALGGKSPYTYSWSNGETTAMITDLVAGGYFVTVTDALGSQKNSLITVQATNRLMVEFDQRAILCGDQADGKVVAIPVGGVAPFTYLWGDGTKKSFLEGIGMGDYHVTVTDANGCRAETSVWIDEPEPLRIGAFYYHVSCGETADGSMRVIAEGGTGAYTFLWELDGKGGATRENLAPGAYSVTLTDANGCTSMICPQIIQSKPPTLSGSSLPETCPGEGDGRGTVTSNGDSSPYRYEWPNNESSYSTAFNLTAGTYVVTVTNRRNCSATVEVVVGQAGGGFGFVVETNGITCGNAPNGQANVRITGGVSPFKYEWIDENTNTIVSTEAAVNTLTPGNYEVRVTDANGCFGQRDVLLVEKPVPTITASAINSPICFGEKTGTAMATASGGTGDFRYEWSNGQTSQNASNLVGGTYNVTATDENGCTAITNVTIIENAPIIINETVSNILCHEEVGGFIKVNASGGAGGYTYAWSNGASTDKISDLLAGIYFLTVTDVDGCEAIKGISIGQPPAIELNVTTSSAADLNSSDGSIMVNVTGGTLPYTYNWNNGETTQNLENIPTGSYAVTVTDGNGCQKTTVVILEANCILITTIAEIQQTSCAGNDGAIFITTSGAKGSLSFEWSNGQTSQNASNLTGGTYSVTVTDKDGCTTTTNVTLITNIPIIINETVSKIPCHEELGGFIKANISGGAGQYTYAWSNGAATDNISDLLAGTYFLTVTDVDGCQVIKGISIGQPPAIELNVMTTSATDLNSADGNIILEATGGILPYTYNWSNGATTQNLENIPAGSYTVTVTDGNGCQKTTLVILEANCTLMAAISETRPTSCAGNDGAIFITTSGAKGALSFQWSNGAKSESLTGVVPGFYGVTIMDGNGCEYIGNTFVTDACNCAQPVLEKVLVFEATCGENDGSIQIEMQGDDNAFNYEWSDAAINGTGATNLLAGSYKVTITDKNNPLCAAIETINIGNSNIGPITLLRNDPEICNGQKGTALLVPGTLTYNWSDGGTGGFRSDLSAGEYLVTVTIPGLDGCMDILNVSIGLESGLNLTTTINQQPDCGKSNGTTTINVAGGSGDYSYSWGAATHHNLPSGTYNITVVDNATSCTESILFTLLDNVPNSIIRLDTISNVSCVGRSDGFIRYELTETTDVASPVTVCITDGKGNLFTADALPVGEYCLIAKDANGCLAGETCFNITEPDFLFVNVTVIPKTCSEDNTILLTTSGGNGQYTYDWADQDGKINPRDRRMIENGSYSVTVSDEANCTIAIDSIMVNGECFICTLEGTATIDAVPECNLPMGAATINVSNVFGKLTYSWGNDSVRTDLLSGPYTVTVTDDFRGCETTVSFTVPELEIPIEATISELIVCPNETGKLVYDVNNFRCFKQPIQVTITDESGTIYDENALPASGNYIFLAADADGEELNRQFFSVEGYKPIITNSSVTNEGCTILGTIDLDLIDAETNYSIQWDDLTGEDQKADRTALSEGNYRVVLTNNTTGCSVTQSFDIQKNTAIAAELAPMALTCDNAPVQVTLEGEGLVEYQWSPAELVMTGQGTATPTLFPSATNPIVKVVAKNAFGCSIEKEVEITSIQTNLPDGIAITPQCNGLTVNFSTTSSSSEYYFWDFGDGNTSDEINPSHTYDIAGDYEVQLRLKPEVPCAVEKGVLANRNVNLVAAAKTEADFDIVYDPCLDEGVIGFKDMSTVNPGTITSWKWNFGNGMTSTEQNPVIELTEGSDLDITLEIITDIGCDGAVSETRSFAVINQPELPLAHTICPEIPTELNPNPVAGVSYEWSPALFLDDSTSANPIVTATKSVDFTVKVTQGGCTKEELVKVRVPKVQEFDISEDEEVCDTTQQLIYVEAPENSAIEWTDATTGAIISKDAELMVSPGVYQVKLTDATNCIVTDMVAIDNYEIAASIIDNTDPCEGGAGLLEVANEGVENITSYDWEDAAGIISGELNQESIEIEPESTTNYTVTVKNDFGCEATLTEEVAVANLLDMVVIPERDTIFKGEFTPINIVPAGDYTIEWAQSPTLSSMSGFDQVAMPEETTTYTVTIIDEATKCSIMREVTVFVRDIACDVPNIFFPNAFSPNGDGNNDVLYVRGNAISMVYFAVYNRWGEKVFESNSKDVGWDGTFNGEVVTTDVYGYYLKVTCFDGEVYETQGNVTVLN